MKDIHPKYNTKATVKCVCGNTFETGSTKDELSTELCNLCHPFYTGTQKIIDSAQRVEKFQTRQTKKSDAPVLKKKEKSAARRAKQAEKKLEENQTKVS